MEMNEMNKQIVKFFIIAYCMQYLLCFS